MGASPAAAGAAWVEDARRCLAAVLLVGLGFRLGFCPLCVLPGVGVAAGGEGVVWLQDARRGFAAVLVVVALLGGGVAAAAAAAAGVGRTGELPLDEWE